MARATARAGVVTGSSKLWQRMKDYCDVRPPPCRCATTVAARYIPSSSEEGSIQGNGREDSVQRRPALNQPSTANSELTGSFDPASLRNPLPARIASQIHATVITKVMGLSQRIPIRMKTADTTMAAPFASR